MLSIKGSKFRIQVNNVSEISTQPSTNTNNARGGILKSIAIDNKFLFRLEIAFNAKFAASEKMTLK